MIRRILVLTVLLALATGITAQAAIITLGPLGGSISGSAGTTVGWGYTVTNDSATDWVVLTGSSFNTPAGWGTYTDYAGLNYVVLAPLADSPQQAFDAVLMFGVGGFAIDPGAVTGSQATGNIQLDYDTYNDDPSVGTKLASGTAQAAAQVTVSDPTATPEPGTMMLLGSGLLAFGLSRFRRRRESIV